MKKRDTRFFGCPGNDSDSDRRVVLFFCRNISGISAVQLHNLSDISVVELFCERFNVEILAANLTGAAILLEIARIIREVVLLGTLFQHDCDGCSGNNSCTGEQSDCSNCLHNNSPYTAPKDERQPLIPVSGTPKFLSKTLSIHIV